MTTVSQAPILGPIVNPQTGTPTPLFQSILARNSVSGGFLTSPVGNNDIAAGISQSKITNLVSNLAAKASLASPSFTGGVSISGGISINGDISETSGDLVLNTIGKGLKIKEGSGSKMGTIVLSSGTATVNNISVTANSRIFLTCQSSSSPGFLYISSITPSTSFIITSSNASDSSTVAWLMLEPA